MTEFESKFEKAEQYFLEKKYLHALQIFQSLLEIPRLKRKALIKLIEIYDIQNQLDSAIKVFEEYLEQSNDDENMRAYYAQFLIRHKKYSEAHDILSSISTQNRPEKNFLIGMVNYFLEDYEISVINFNEFISQNSKSDLIAEAYLYIGKCKIKQGDLDAALVYLEKSESIDNQNHEIYFSLALVYYLKEMYFHSLEELKKSISLDPSDVESLELSAKILFKLGEYEKSRRDFALLLNRTEPSAEIFALLGFVCKNMKDFESANFYFESALKLNPSDKSVLLAVFECKSSMN